MENSFDMELETPELETISSLAQHLVYRLPGCDNAMIRLTLREIYRDFCRRSCCLRVRRRFAFHGHGEYNLVPMFGGTITNIVEVRLGRHVLLSNRDWRFCVGRLIVLSHAAPHEWIIHDGHRREAEVEVEFIEVPALSSEEAPKWVLDKYGETICSGVLARLMSMSNKAWSDPQMAAIESARYEAGVNDACLQLYSPKGDGTVGNVFDTRDLI